jgi:hypothetical protein
MYTVSKFESESEFEFESEGENLKSVGYQILMKDLIVCL